MDVDFYASPGPLTELTAGQTEMIRRLGLDATDLCRVAQRLLVSPPDAAGAGLSERRLDERNTRPASSLLRRALELDRASPLDEPRPADRRVVGTCRHFAVRATAFLRAADIPARARCGFAAYFVPPTNTDKPPDQPRTNSWHPQPRDDVPMARARYAARKAGYGPVAPQVDTTSDRRGGMSKTQYDSEAVVNVVEKDLRQSTRLFHQQ